MPRIVLGGLWFDLLVTERSLPPADRLAARCGPVLAGADAIQHLLGGDGADLELTHDCELFAGALRACGLSAQRAQTLWSLAQAIASKELTAASLASCPSAEAAARLRQVKGIGPWSANLILLRGLGRLDVFPPGDVGVARGLGAIFADGSDADSASTEHAVARVVERFGDRRGYLYFYSLGADLLRRGLVHAASNEAAPTR